MFVLCAYGTISYMCHLAFSGMMDIKIIHRILHAMHYRKIVHLAVIMIKVILWKMWNYLIAHLYYGADFEDSMHAHS